MNKIDTLGWALDMARRRSVMPSVTKRPDSTPTRKALAAHGVKLIAGQCNMRWVGATFVLGYRKSKENLTR